ncbi:uncharacterized protein BDZ83DRAFT_13949 [Colletotrichum acutatum]|uniref:Uncharacterized protein n=1 Tax=Glomerella acutata TaxID=27357 RepID=A0AAD8XLU5_GLOAC|nr:uncharacterized protein BDZ83DRAFT_13949 [Colletotrichum acutatum]KAK1729674.1 hypothetical protein BDZ83DRAFT_13949 [Colletotrichum acutatum]
MSLRESMGCLFWRTLMDNGTGLFFSSAVFPLPGSSPRSSGTGTMCYRNQIDSRLGVKQCPFQKRSIKQLKINEIKPPVLCNIVNTFLVRGLGAKNNKSRPHDSAKTCRHNAPLRVTTTPTAHLTKIDFFLAYAYHFRPGTRRGLADAPCDLGRSASLNLRSFHCTCTFAPAAQVPAHPPTPRPLAYLTLRSRAACLAQLRLVLPACHERTGLQSKFHDDDRFPRPDILTTRPLPLLAF